MLSEWVEIVTRYSVDLATAPWLKAIIGFVMTSALVFAGLNTKAMEALLLLMALDYVLGTAHAWKDGKPSARKFFRGIGKFVVYGLALKIASLSDVGMGTADLGFSLANLLCGYLCANEALSALTHLGEFGVPIPTWLFERLRTYRNKIEQTESQQDVSHL